MSDKFTFNYSGIQISSISKCMRLARTEFELWRMHYHFYEFPTLWRLSRRATSEAKAFIIN